MPVTVRVAFRHWPVLFLVGVVWGALLLGIYWLAWAPAALVTTTAGTVEVDATHPDNPVLVVHRRWCIAYRASVLVQRRLIDHFVHQLPDQVITLEPGCDDRPRLSPLPEALPAGHYRYEVTVYQRVNPLRTVAIPLPSIAFDVPGPAGSPAPALPATEDAPF